MKKRVIITAFLWIAVASCMIFIFSMSAQPAHQSTETSGMTIRAICRLLNPNFDNIDEARQAVIIESYQHAVRKCAHFSIYMILGILLFAAISNHTDKIQIRISLSVLSGALYAASDELHQFFVPGRSCQMSDILLDTSGVAAGVIIACLIYCLVISLKKRKSNCRNKK